MLLPALRMHLSNGINVFGDRFSVGNHKGEDTISRFLTI